MSFRLLSDFRCFISTLLKITCTVSSSEYVLNSFMINSAFQKKILVSFPIFVIVFDLHLINIEYIIQLALFSYTNAC